MEAWSWITQHGFEMLQSAGIIGAFLFNAFSFRAESKARHVGNLLDLTSQHREIWAAMLERPDLSRILQTTPDLANQPITQAEELFVGFLILHLNAAFQAMRQGMFTSPERLREDIQHFFTLTIPRIIWNESRKYQDRSFLYFVETSLDDA